MHLWLHNALRGSAVDVVRLTIWFALLMAFFVFVETIFAHESQPVFRKGWWADVGLYFVNGILPKLVLLAPVSALAWMARAAMPGFIIHTSASLPLWARLAASMVVGEVGYYWAHRWTHQIPFLWRFHSVHHAPQQVDWLVNTHAHPVDIVFTRMCMFVPLYCLGLAQPLDGHHLDPVPLLLVLFATLWGFFQHANVKWRFDWLSEVIATPAFHHWHHTADEHIDRNYASMLPVLDRVFGTRYLPKGEWPPAYGLHQPAPKVEADVRAAGDEPVAQVAFEGQYRASQEVPHEAGA